MSKKNKKATQSYMNVVVGGAGISAHAEEYAIIKHDLVRVVLLNILYLAGVLALYYSNSQTHYLENWFSKILHF